VRELANPTKFQLETWNEETTIFGCCYQ